jgi:hypothetical protein
MNIPTTLNSHAEPQRISSRPFRESLPSRRRASLMASFADELSWNTSNVSHPEASPPKAKGRVFRFLASLL